MKLRSLSHEDLKTTAGAARTTLLGAWQCNLCLTVYDSYETAYACSGGDMTAIKKEAQSRL